MDLYDIDYIAKKILKQNVKNVVNGKDMMKKYGQIEFSSLF